MILVLAVRQLRVLEAVETVVEELVLEREVLVDVVDEVEEEDPEIRVLLLLVGRAPIVDVASTPTVRGSSAKPTGSRPEIGTGPPTPCARSRPVGSGQVADVPVTPPHCATR